MPGRAALWLAPVLLAGCTEAGARAVTDGAAVAQQHIAGNLLEVSIGDGAYRSSFTVKADAAR